MNESFDQAFAFLMEFEGYKSDDPADAGGRTIFGISARAHPEVVARLWDLPKDEALVQAEAFYKVKYWLPLCCDSMEFPDDVYLFDAGVNMGIGRATELFNASESAFDFLMLRIDFYVSISKGANAKFLRGWLRRVVALYRRFQ